MLSTQPHITLTVITKHTFTARHKAAHNDQGIFNRGYIRQNVHGITAMLVFQLGDAIEKAKLALAGGLRRTDGCVGRAWSGHLPNPGGTTASKLRPPITNYASTLTPTCNSAGAISSAGLLSPRSSLFSAPFDSSIASSLNDGSCSAAESTTSFHTGTRIPLYFQRMRNTVVRTMLDFPRLKNITQMQLDMEVATLNVFMREYLNSGAQDKTMLCLHLVRLRTLHEITSCSTDVDCSGLVALHCYLFEHVGRLPCSLASVRDYVWETGIAFQDDLWPLMPKAIVQLITQCTYNVATLDAIIALEFELVCNSGCSGEEDFDPNQFARTLMDLDVAVDQVHASQLRCAALCGVRAMAVLEPELSAEISLLMSSQWSAAFFTLPKTLRGYGVS